MSNPYVAVLMGSDSDLKTMQACLDVLKQREVPYEVKITPAHRTPETTHANVKDAGYLAAQMLALADAGVAGRRKAERKANTNAVRAMDAELQASLK
jgi:5-(carboxyamino)imidazole ribonucleotide mutase